jgi:hypothetical protein
MTQKAPWIPEHHSWRWRFVVAILMFVMVFVGVTYTAINKTGSWGYWRLLSCIFALLSLGLSAYLRKQAKEPFLVTFWHEVLHWTGLILVMGLLSLTVKLGIVSPFAASLQTLMLLSFATFLAGVYIEKTFFFISALLGFFALILSFVSLYSYFLFIPTLLIAFGALWWFVRKKSHQMSHQ